MTIVQGDCLEELPKLPDGGVDLVITSPPYNVGNVTMTGGGIDPIKVGDGYTDDDDEQIDLYEGWGDDMPREKYVEWQRKVLDELMRLLKPTGAIFYNHRERPFNKLLVDNYDILQGYPVRQRIIWHRRLSTNFNVSHFAGTYEVIYLICKPDFKLLPGKTGIGDVWQFHPESNNTHPAPFPIQIPQRCISSCLEPDLTSWVIDPFLGSGTTGLAADDYGVSWLGIEKSKKYARMAQKRLDLQRAQYKLDL